MATSRLTSSWRVDTRRRWFTLAELMVDPPRLAGLTTGRQDYGILRSSILALAADALFELRVWAGGMHLSSAHGHTIDLVREDGVAVDRELDFLQGADVAIHAARAVEAVGAAID